MSWAYGEGLRKEEAAKGQHGKQIPRRQYASQLLGLVSGSGPESTAHSSALLWEENKEGPLLLTIPLPALLTSPLHSYPQLPGKGLRNLPCCPHPAQPASQALPYQPSSCQEAAPTPPFPASFPLGLGLSWESGSPGWDLLCSSGARGLHVLLVCFHPWFPRC